VDDVLHRLMASGDDVSGAVGSDLATRQEWHRVSFDAHQCSGPFARMASSRWCRSGVRRSRPSPTGLPRPLASLLEVAAVDRFVVGVPSSSTSRTRAAPSMMSARSSAASEAQRPVSWRHGGALPYRCASRRRLGFARRRPDPGVGREEGVLTWMTAPTPEACTGHPQLQEQTGCTSAPVGSRRDIRWLGR
jgi:hypothetical protein